MSATPEKALLDLVHLTPGADSPAYLRELRLQNLERLDLGELRRLRRRRWAAPSCGGRRSWSPAWRTLRLRSTRRCEGLSGATWSGPRRSPAQARNVAREYLQARILAALQRAGAMIPLAFHGGTALRFLYASGRYSEDLDFALEKDRDRYDFRGYLQAIRGELAPEGYAVELKVSDQQGRPQRLRPLPGAALRAGAFAEPERGRWPSRSR